MRIPTFSGHKSLIVRALKRFSFAKALTERFNSSMLFVNMGEALSGWERERVRTGTKPHNAHKQATRLRSFFAEQGWGTVDCLTRQAIVSALQGMQGRSVATVLTMQCQISGFCKYPVECGALESNPCDTIPAPKRPRGRTRRKGVRAFTTAEIEALVRAAEADEQAENPDHAAQRSVLYRLAALTGARYGQLVRSLAWGDIDFDAKAITFDRDHAKNGEGVTLPLHAEALQTLLAWRERCRPQDPTEYVFPKRIQDRILDRDMQAAGVRKRDASGRPAAFHSFRKAFATSLVASRVPVNVAQRLMQHKTLQMTLEIYAEVQESGLIDGLSTLQVFKSQGFTRYREKSFAERGERLDKGGDSSEDDGHAVRRFSHNQSVPFSGPARDEQHSTLARPENDADCLLGSWRGPVGSPLPNMSGGSSPPLGIQNGQSEAKQGRNDPPLTQTLADLLELAASILRQTAKGSASESG